MEVKIGDCIKSKDGRHLLRGELDGIEVMDLDGMKDKRKHYLGDVKWVLYQYICDMGSDNINIRCGNFAWNKLVKNEAGYIEFININGESVTAIHLPEMDKKQLIISTHDFTNGRNVYDYTTPKIDTTEYPGDIVLYFA